MARGRPRKQKETVVEKVKDDGNVAVMEEVKPAEVIKPVSRTSPQTALRSKVEEKKARENVMVKGRFMSLQPGKREVNLPYHNYADDPLVWKTFKHGEVYEIKQGFADMLNHYSCKITDERAEDGSQALTGKQHREPIYAFTPLAF